MGCNKRGAREEYDTRVREDFIPGPDAGYWRFLIFRRRRSLSQRVCDAKHGRRGRQAPIKNLLTITVEAGQAIEISQQLIESSRCRQSLRAFI